MLINLQPILENQLIILQPLQETDFEPLYAVASDPLIWEQHPNKNRYQREVFQNYFNGAIESGGALLVLDKKTGEVAGCTRYYEYNKADNSVFIGYTFIARQYWGKGYNPAMKQLMLQHAFQFVHTVLFHVGAENKRSQIAMERAGGVKRGEVTIAYYGEPDRLNIEYEIRKDNWLRKNEGGT